MGHQLKNTGIIFNVNMGKEFPYVETKSSIADIFPKENIFYLTSASKKPYRYHHDDVCVLQPTADLEYGAETALATARMLGVNHAQIPLMDFVNEGMRKKILRTRNV